MTDSSTTSQTQPTLSEYTSSDQLGRVVTVPYPVQRIISLVPSQTELLFALGVGEQVVGRTKFCVHPQPDIEQVQSIGGTKKFRYDVIEQLNPDLIIGNKEENYQEGFDWLNARYAVWMSDVRTLPQAFAMIKSVGDLVGARHKAADLLTELQAQFDQLKPAAPPKRVAYFIWNDPKMVVGADTFINDMLQRCGFENPFATETHGRYPELTNAEIQAANLDTILLSSEPFPFTEKHLPTYQQLAPQAQIILTDGELFSWYGNRLLKAAPYFQHLIQTLTP